MKVFTSIFAFECIIKLMALSKDFFLCGWNIFDLIIVSASLVDIIFELVDGLSVLRGLRLVSGFQPESICSDSIFSQSIAVARAQTGTVLDDDESVAEHHHINDWRSRKSNTHFGYCYLYFRRYRYAIVFERLHAGEISPGSRATVRRCPN